MLHQRPEIEHDVLQALDAAPARVPVVLGPSGSGRTSVLQRVAARLAGDAGHYVDAERIISTPERFLAAVTASGHEPDAAIVGYHSPRAAFDTLLARIGQPQRLGQPQSVLILDEFIELNMLAPFPGLRGALREFIDAIARSPNRFVLASRYVNRATRLLASLPAARFTLIHLPPLTTTEVRDVLAEQTTAYYDTDLLELASGVQALVDGRPAYVHHMAVALGKADGVRDPVSALATLMNTGAPLAAACRFAYELRLHRARGYSALKGILATLAADEPLTLSGIARRLGRTPGSTRDYLSWLADVDLVTMEEKRYRFSDPLLRLWVRLHCHASPPDDIALEREVQEYSVRRLPRVGTAADDRWTGPARDVSLLHPLRPRPPVDPMEFD